MSTAPDSIVVYNKVSRLDKLKDELKMSEQEIKQYVADVKSKNSVYANDAIDIKAHGGLCTIPITPVETRQAIAEAIRIPIHLSAADQAMVDAAHNIEQWKKASPSYQLGILGELNVVAFVAGLGGVSIWNMIEKRWRRNKKIPGEMAWYLSKGKWTKAALISLCTIAPNIYDIFNTKISKMESDRKDAIQNIYKKEKIFDPNNNLFVMNLAIARYWAYTTYTELLEEARKTVDNKNKDKF